jgi:hypothetical protein
VHLHVQCPYVSYVLQKNRPFLLVFHISLIYIFNSFGKAFAVLFRCICMCCITHFIRVTVALLWHLSRDRFVAFRVGLNLR